MESIYQLPRTALHMNPATDRFESWLRSHGYEPMHDPFMDQVAGAELCDQATDLVDDYLRDRPLEEPNRHLLREHARLLGDVTCLWGDGVGLALAG